MSGATKLPLGSAHHGTSLCSVSTLIISKPANTSCSLHLLPSFILIFHVHSPQLKSYLCLLFSKSHISVCPALSTTFFQLRNSSSTLELGPWGRYSRWEESGCGTFLFLVALLLEPEACYLPIPKAQSCLGGPLYSATLHRFGNDSLPLTPSDLGMLVVSCCG